MLLLEERLARLEETFLLNGGGWKTSLFEIFLKR